MASMTGGEALVRSLVNEGVRVVFGLPGVQLYGAIVALRDEPRIRVSTPRHAGATTCGADGYARAGGQVGVALVVPGPGLLNAASGLSTAYAASSPVLMIAGQIPRAHIGRDLGMLHEVNDQLDAVAPVTKWRGRALEVREIPGVVREAFRQLGTGRPRPVAIDIPPDALEDEDEVDFPPVVPAARSAAPAADVDRAAEMLLAAARPVIYAGGGVLLSGAGDALGAVAEYLQAPVATTAEGKGAISDHRELSLGAAVWKGSAVREVIETADLLLVVGSRVAVVPWRADQQVVQIDVDPAQIGRTHAKTFGLVGDARATLEVLLERLRAAGAPRPSRKAEHEALRERIAAYPVKEPQGSILRSLRAGTPENAIVVAGMTQIGYNSRPFWPVYEPRTYLTSSYSGNLGFEYPTALGAKVARPDRPVVAICGDGGFMYAVQELATAVQHGIHAVAVVFNDGAYGNVGRDLDEMGGAGDLATLRNPDFMALAAAFGVTGLRASRPDEVGGLVARAIDLDRPVLVEVPVGRMPKPEFFMPLRVPAKYRRS